MARLVVLIDGKDNVLGFKEKFATHKIPVPLHRAISIVIFNKDRTKMLITKRASAKPTWGGVWSNSVCTHPYPDETYQKAAERRLVEELGFKTPLKELSSFTYEAKMDNGTWGEHELDHVFIGTHEGEAKPDPKEISEYKWIRIEELERDIKKNPNIYTPWFKIILEKLDL